MNFCIMLLVTAMAFTCVMARHIHPKDEAALAIDSYWEDGKLTELKVFEEEQNSELNPMTAVKNLRPSWFVPINNVFAFKRNEPCEDGYKRDILGICREVWD